MNDVHSLANEIANNIYTKGIKPLLVENENYVFIKDPVFGIRRNRVVGEVVKAIIKNDLEKDEKIVFKLCKYLEKTQNKDGSWNEIHPNYDEPSALVTSIVGMALLAVYKRFPSRSFEKSIYLVRDHILSQMETVGRFKKSKKYTADYLNADATCGAFLASFGKFFSDENCIKVAEQTARHVCNYQFADGSFPYTINNGNNSYLLNVPCIHYQGVTMYYLSKINEVLEKEWLKDSLTKGGEWLSIVQKRDGRFDWSKSGLMFSYYLSGAYAFAFSSFIYLSGWDKKYLENAKLCLDVLKRNFKGLFYRWENDSWINLPLSFPIALKSAWMGDYPFKYRLFRFGYGLYRQIARRRFSEEIDNGISENLTNFLKVKSSTIEPFSNFLDLFITSEVFDCISTTLSSEKEVE